MSTVATSGQTHSIDGPTLVRMLHSAKRWLDASVANLNATNVFPVPDGDTGTNMIHTLNRALSEVVSLNGDEPAVERIARALAKGAFFGARGNSGVILSQIFGGIADGLEGLNKIDGEALGRSLNAAADRAYRAVTAPVEGTMLTVIRDAGRSAGGVVPNDAKEVFRAAVDAARDSVLRTPELLPVLARSGVVDAGAQGLLVILDGMLNALEGREDTPKYPVVQSNADGAPVAASPLENHEGQFGYCTEFIIDGDSVRRSEARTRFSEVGDSLVIAGIPGALRVHIHTEDPGRAVCVGMSMGLIHDVSIRNMDDQHASAPGSFAVIASADGGGVGAALRSLGAIVIPVDDAPKADRVDFALVVDSVATQEMVLLPNNPLLLPDALNAAAASKKDVVVIPTLDEASGMAALMARLYGEDLHACAAAMRAAATELAVFSVLREEEYRLVFRSKDVARSASFDGLGSAIAQVAPPLSSVVTIYTGAEATAEQTASLISLVARAVDAADVEVVAGGQRRSLYQIAFE